MISGNGMPLHFLVGMLGPTRQIAIGMCHHTCHDIAGVTLTTRPLSGLQVYDDIDPDFLLIAGNQHFASEGYKNTEEST